MYTFTKKLEIKKFTEEVKVSYPTAVVMFYGDAEATGNKVITNLTEIISNPENYVARIIIEETEISTEGQEALISGHDYSAALELKKNNAHDMNKKFNKTFRAAFIEILEIMRNNNLTVPTDTEFKNAIIARAKNL